MDCCFALELLGRCMRDKHPVFAFSPPAQPLAARRLAATATATDLPIGLFLHLHKHLMPGHVA